MPPTAPPFPFRAAAVVHLALVASCLTVVGIFWFLRGGVTIALLPESRGMLRYIGFGAAALLLVTAVALKGRVPVVERGTDISAWWAQHRSRVLALWALGDLGGVAGATLWFLTDDQLVLLSLGGAGLLILAAYRPSKLFTYM